MDYRNYISSCTMKENRKIMSTANFRVQYDKKDYYRESAAEHFGVPYEEVTVEQRTFVKHILYSKAYRGGTINETKD